MGTRRLIVGVLLLAAPLLAGCGGNRSGATKAMDAKFERIDYEMATLETVTSNFNEAHFEQATQKYIALVRRYADALGPAEAKRRLKQKGDELGPYCLPCVGILDDEATRY